MTRGERSKSTSPVSSDQGKNPRKRRETPASKLRKPKKGGSARGREKLRFLVNSIAATRGTLARLTCGFYEGWVSERELRVLCYALRTIGSLFYQGDVEDLQARIAELEKKVLGRETT